MVQIWCCTVLCIIPFRYKPVSHASTALSMQSTGLKVPSDESRENVYLPFIFFSTVLCPSLANSMCHATCSLELNERKPAELTITLPRAFVTSDYNKLLKVQCSVFMFPLATIASLSTSNILTCTYILRFL